MDRLCTEFSLNAVAVTRGAKGALLVAGEKHLALPDSNVDQARIHPVGAGDSFAAGLLFGFMNDWPPEASLHLANILSSWVVHHASATPPLPEFVLSRIRALAAEANTAGKL
jgi:sugar/nucleoside kinase (ribokinase family)